MAQRDLDARGLACPQPVLLTRKAMLEPGVDRVSVLVDNDASVENVQRMARSQGWAAEVERLGEETRLTIEPAAEAAGQSSPKAAVAGGPPNVAVFLTSNLFGDGDEQLGRVLMKAFVKTLREIEPLPTKVMLANSGVRLTTEGSELIEDLRGLENLGIEVISCGTCLDYYGLKDSLQVGVASNMYEIASSLVAADRIVHL